jgi:glycosyltransferase involved in cell wall biosynthesis
VSLKILWSLPYLPWPLVGGNKVRQFHLLRGLAKRGHRVTLLVQSKVPLDEDARAALTPLVERLIVLERRPRKHPLTLAAALLAPYPVVVSVNGLSRDLRSAIAELLREEWDAVQVEHSYGLQAVLGVLCNRRQPFALCEHNVESSLTAITNYHPRIPSALVGHLRRYDGWRYRNWERRVLRVPARLIAVTPQDAEQLADISGRSVDIIANGVDARGLSGVRPDFAGRRILFVGNYEYAPNAAAVEMTLKEILPLIWRRIPTARFAVCGHAMPPAWRTRWKDPRIEWCGFVSDLSVEQRKSAVLIAPLAGGGGSKLKVLESMAAGLPVVCTHEGVSGLSVQDGREYREGRTAPDLAARVVELLENEADARRIGEAGRAYVSRQHDWLRLVDQLVEIYRTLPRRV